MVAIQVRDVPDEVREVLLREAQRRDQSLQVYLMDVLEREARSTKNLEWLESWRPVGTAPSLPSGVQLVHDSRQERERDLMEALGSDAADRE